MEWESGHHGAAQCFRDLVVAGRQRCCLFIGGPGILILLWSCNGWQIQGLSGGATVCDFCGGGW